MPNKRSTSKKTASRGSIAIVASRFNEFITLRLLKACQDELSRRGFTGRDVTVLWVPGSFEVPVMALHLAQKKSVRAVICLGAVIRGETFHFELVAQSVARGIMQASLMTGKPIIFGVLSTDTVEQANKRSEPKGDNKGREAAVTAVSMIETIKALGT